jgi:hypothetical protein
MSCECFPFGQSISTILQEVGILAGLCYGGEMTNKETHEGHT